MHVTAFLSVLSKVDNFSLKKKSGIFSLKLNIFRGFRGSAP